MQSKILSSAAVLLSLASSVLAAGSAHVVNNCGYDVYYAYTGQGNHNAMTKLPAGGMSQSYDQPGVGISIKLAKNPSGSVAQFEYTWADDDIHYDISNIDGNPFMEEGTSLSPSAAGASGYPTCKTVSCPAGASTCEEAYNLPDDVRTMVCPQSSDLTFTLCSGGSRKRAEEEKRSEDVPQRVHARHMPKLT